MLQYPGGEAMLDLDIVLAIDDYTVEFLDGTTIDTKYTMQIANYWSYVDPACVVLIQPEKAVVVNLHYLMYASPTKVVVGCSEYHGYALEYKITRANYAQLQEKMAVFLDIMERDCLGEYIKERQEEFVRNRTPRLPPASPLPPVASAEVEHQRARLQKLLEIDADKPE